MNSERWVTNTHTKWEQRGQIYEAASKTRVFQNGKKCMIFLYLQNTVSLTFVSTLCNATCVWLWCFPNRIILLFVIGKQKNIGNENWIRTKRFACVLTISCFCSTHTCGLKLQARSSGRGYDTWEAKCFLSRTKLLLLKQSVSCRPLWVACVTKQKLMKSLPF